MVLGGINDSAKHVPKNLSLQFPGPQFPQVSSEE